MSASRIHGQRMIAALIGVAVLSLGMNSTAFADGEEDDDFEISPMCRAKPWLPACDPGETPNPPPPQDPFPCDFLLQGCPWWQF